jgi:DNA (cytosine-5)-methyltransferase 1
MNIGSLFSGIGGLEYGLELAMPFAKIKWQVEQNKYCQSILAKHWPDTIRYNNVLDVGSHNLEKVDLICGGFPCQDISKAGKGRGLDGVKSGLWFEMSRIISELRPRIAVLENVPAITIRGLDRVLYSLASMGYDAEWTNLSAQAFGAPHKRNRWCLVAYSNSDGSLAKPIYTESMEEERMFECSSSKIRRLYTKNYWKKHPPKSTICHLDDGIPHRVARLKALGNAVVPQCAQYIGEAIVNSGLIDDLIPQPQENK